MLRSMFSAASAIRNHQTYMDVVANNIANINTTGYKTTRITFQELMSQMLTPGSAATDQRGGVNPMQVGLGMNVGSVDSIFTLGPMQNTGRNTDLALDGNGFFMFQGANQNLYSRDGSLDLGIDGSLVSTATGLRVMGWNAAADGTVDTNGAAGVIIVPLNQGLAQATQNVGLSGNINAALAARSVSSSQTVAGTVDGFGAAAALGTGLTELATGDYYVEVRTDAGTGQFRVVDSQGNPVSVRNGGGGLTSDWQAIPAGTFDTGRGLTIDFGAGPAYADGVRGAGAANVHYSAQSVTAQVQVYDSLGAQHTINLNFLKDATTANRWTWQATTDEAGVTVGTTAASPITFTQTGQYAATNTAASLSLSFTNGAANQVVSLNFDSLTQLAQDTNLGAPVQDGSAPGQLNDIEIGTDGSVTGVYSNGMHRVVAQLSIASFANPGGLLRVGDNMYTQWTNSGAADVGVAGADGRGNVRAEYLESANVDLAQQFTNMITAQRGFQANSRVISASDQMLQDLVSLVR